MNQWIYEQRQASNPLEWIIKLPNGEEVVWKGFTSGPLNLSKEEIEGLCEKLLGIPLSQLSEVASLVLQPIVAPKSINKSLVLHSTTADLGAFEGDFAFLQRQMKPKNYAGYVETRAVYLGKEDDVAVGRMSSWEKGIEHSVLNAIEVPNLTYYYLSHYLLTIAAVYPNEPNEALEKIITYLKENPQTTIRLYVLDTPIQIFLTWLQRISGLDKIYIDANSPEVSRVWNNKNILYPTVKAAQDIAIAPIDTAKTILKKEQLESLLYKNLGLNLDALPGYVIQRQGKSLDSFEQQLLEAAQLLYIRYGLQKGCLKAGESGDGGRITPNIDLKDTNQLKTLAKEAYKFGDDYVLECHFHYATSLIGKDTVSLTPSAHIRSGQVASGITLQFKRGTSWMGNLYVSEILSEQIGISLAHYHKMQDAIQAFLQAFQQRNLGLTIAGIDFAIGHIGGKFGGEPMMAIQDPNISFNGAEFLRVFMEKARKQFYKENDQIFALTWVFIPTIDCTYKRIEAIFSKNVPFHNYCEIIALVPNSWGMIGVSSSNFEDCILQWEVLKKQMIDYCQ